MSGRTHRHENNITATGYRLVSGTIETSTSIGLEIGGSNASLLVYNDGMVSGQTGIALLGSDAQLTNYGTVVGTSKVGVSLSGGGTITNDAGLIEGAKWGVVLDAGDTLINMYGAAVAGTSRQGGQRPGRNGWWRCRSRHRHTGEWGRDLWRRWRHRHRLGQWRRRRGWRGNRGCRLDRK